MGTRESLLGKKFEVEKINCFVNQPDIEEELKVQIRYKSAPVSARLVSVDKPVWSVKLCQPVYAISPGQSAVFYRDECLIAGGKIRQAN